MAAQPPLNFTIQPPPVNTASTSTFTLASFDVANMPGIGGNFTDCTIFIRATILMHEVGGGGYSSSWEKVGTFRRVTTGNPALTGSMISGNSDDPAGQVGSGDLSTFAMDVSTTTIRLRVTPAGSGSLWWYGKLEVTAIEPA